MTHSNWLIGKLYWLILSGNIPGRWHYLFIILSLNTTPARAAEDVEIAKNVMPDLQSCRKIADAAGRGSCYARVLDRVGPEIDAGSIAIIDVRSRSDADRRHFGLSGGGGSRPDNKRVTRVVSRINTLSPNADGSWMVALADGTVWRTAGAVNGRVSAGTEVVIVRDQFSRFKMSAANDRKTIVYRVR